MRLTGGLSAASLVFAALVAAPAFAQPLTGQFNLSGTVEGTSTGLEFFASTPGDNMAAAVLPNSGSFNNLVPYSMQTINSLSSSNGVVPGTNFDYTNWIVLTNGINLDLTGLTVPNDPVCSSTSMSALNTVCLAAPGSPIVLTQDANGVTAHLNVNGYAHMAGSSELTAYTGLFTSALAGQNGIGYTNIEDFELAYAANGDKSPIEAYQANFVMQGSSPTVPEPQTVALIAGGLLVGFGLRKKLGLRKA
jgi:hypothetical protein